MERRINMKLIIMFTCYVLLASSGLILFKLGSTNNNLTLNIFGLSINYSIKMILGLLCYGFSFILWMLIVSKMNLTFAMPLSVAIVNTLVVVGSCLVLKEKITLTQGVGIFIVILGVCIMTWGKK
jgi:small multidrug resistance pump